MLGNIIVGLLLAGAIALAVRSLWRNRKAGKNCGSCSGDCANCRARRPSE